MERWIEGLADAGVVSRRTLLRAGIPEPDVDALRRAGALAVIRRGWYRTPTADPTVVATVRAGGAISCVSALARHPGVWAPPGTELHVRWLRAQGRSSCRTLTARPPLIRAVDPLPVAVGCAANCVPPDYLIAVLDSLFRMPHPWSRDDIRDLFPRAPQRVLRCLDRLDPHSGSGTESVVRARLRAANIAVRSQVVIPGLGRVDLLVGDRLIIECDSRQFHSDQRRNDNRRDRVATVGNYRVLRIDYAEVMFHWDAVFAEVLAMVRTRRHHGCTDF